MKQKLLLKTMLLLCALIAGSSSVWATDPVSSAVPANGKSYVIAAYVNSKYYALPNGAVNGGTIAGTEISLNALNKVSSSVASGKTWTLEEGTDANAGYYYIKYTSGSDTYYLYKNGTGTSNHNFAVNKTSKNYWSFTANGTAYTVAAIDRGTNHVNIKCASGTFSCDGTATPIILLEVGDPDTPEANVTPTALNFGKVDFGYTKDLTFTITPSNLTGNLTIASNNAKYNVSPTTIPQSTTTATTITVTAAPTAINDNMSGSITISGGGLSENKTVTLSCTVTDPSKGIGTLERPYTVADVRDLNPTSTSSAKETDVYVTGYIVGCCDGSTGAFISASGSLVNTNLALADDPTNTSSIISVQLSSGTNRTNYNVLDHPDHIGITKVLIKADVFKYCGIPGLKNIDEMSAVSIDVTIAGSRYSSLAKPFGLDFSGVAGLEAYVASAVSASAVTLTAINEAPASTGVILKGTGNATYTIPVKADAAAVGTNYLKAAVTAYACAANEVYILQGGKFCKVTAASTVPAGKAYLLANDVPASAPGYLGFDFGSTNISTTNFTNDTNNSGEFYNLAGQRVANPTKGLYIVNGKKVIIK